jgi:hypothetical protein
MGISASTLLRPLTRIDLRLKVGRIFDYCIISTLGSRVFLVTEVTRRFVGSWAFVTCDEPIFRLQKTFRRYFYD